MEDAINPSRLNDDTAPVESPVLGAEPSVLPESTPVIAVQAGEIYRHQAILNDDPASEQAGTKEWLKSHAQALVWSGAGALALGSVGLTIASDKFGEAKDRAMEAVWPWGTAGVAVTEAAFIIGGVLMLGPASKRLGPQVRNIGTKARNLFRVRKEIAAFQEQVVSGNVPETQTPLVDSKVFRAGFVLNFAGALGSAGVLAAAVATMPHESWGLMSIAGADILATLSLRGLVWKGLKMGRRSHQEHPDQGYV